MKKLEKLQNKKIEFTNKIRGGNTIALEESVDLADSTTTAHKPTQTAEHVSCDHRVDIKQNSSGIIVYY